MQSIEIAVPWLGLHSSTTSLCKSTCKPWELLARLSGENSELISNTACAYTFNFISESMHMFSNGLLQFILKLHDYKGKILV